MSTELGEHYRVVYRHYRYPLMDMRFCYPWSRPQVAKEPKRYYRRFSDWQDWFYPHVKGGRTEAEIQHKDDTTQEWETVVVGESKCMLIDNFCYKTGRDLALEDAMVKFERMKYE